MSEEIQRDLGRLEARADSTDERLERIEGKVDQLVQWMQQSKGGLRTLIAVGTIAGAVGAGVAKAVAMVKGGS
jgi:hypothetical protein